jgi:hypothetical protein
VTPFVTPAGQQEAIMNHGARIWVVASVLSPAVALAEPLPKPVADMERLVGTWKGAGTLKAAPDATSPDPAMAVKLQASWTCQHTSARFGVMCQFQVRGIPGVPSYEETDLLGYDAAAGTYHWYSVTNAGETHDHVAPAAAGDSLRFVYRGSQEGKPLEEVITLVFSDRSRRLEGKAETYVAGTLASVLAVSLAK